MMVDLPRLRDPASNEFNALKRELGSLVMKSSNVINKLETALRQD